MFYEISYDVTDNRRRLKVAKAPPQFVGRTVNNVTAPGEINVVAVTREGRALIPTLGTQFGNGHTIHFAVLASAMERFESWLGLGEGG